MKVLKYTIYRNGEEECFFWVPISQAERLNLILTKLMPTSNYQFDYKETEIN